MSTVKSNIKIENNAKLVQRLAKINQINEVIFHTDDLANLWGITKANTLHTTLTRYTASGLFYRIYRGLYSIKPLSKLDPLLLGIKALHKYAYVTTETVLIQAGVVLQVIVPITMVSNKSKKFEIGENKYYSRQLAEQYLYKTSGISEVNGVRQANLSRAVADLLYFNKNAHFDAPQLINWREVKKIQQNLGYPLTQNRYDFIQPQRG